METFVECVVCGKFHRKEYTGDCRNDQERFNEEDLPKDADIIWLGN